MTCEEERIYLAELCLEAARWRVDRDDPCCALELEVRDRLRRLSGIETKDAEGTVHGDPVVNPVLTDKDYRALEAAKLDEHLASPKKVDEARKAWEKMKVRCSENGKLVWHLRSECHQEPMFPGNPMSKKFKWVWDGPQDKKAQEEAMWAAHEQGEE